MCEWTPGTLSASLVPWAGHHPLLSGPDIIASTFVLEDAETVLGAVQVTKGKLPAAVALGSLSCRQADRGQPAEQTAMKLADTLNVAAIARSLDVSAMVTPRAVDGCLSDERLKARLRNPAP
jgi:hypothetical protein